jgi:hypothetical protein
MLIKTTSKLFRGIYQYKIVLVCPNAHFFRNSDWQQCLHLLQKSSISPGVRQGSLSFKSIEDKDYALALYEVLSVLVDLNVRIENPWITVYTNNKSHLDDLTKLDKTRVKYICLPPANVSLSSDTVIMPKMNYDFQVTLGKTTQEHSAFISWAASNQKLKLTKSCIAALTRNRSWGGTHFYVTGDNNLLMSKMHLGGSISKVSRIIKA